MQAIYDKLCEKYEAAPWYTAWLWGLGFLVVLVLAVFMLKDLTEKKEHEKRREELDDKADNVIRENDVETARVEEHLDAHAAETAELEKEREEYEAESAEREELIEEIKDAGSFDELDDLKDQL